MTTYLDHGIRANAFGTTEDDLMIAVDEDGTVRVWDDVAGYYTTCHSLSPEDAHRCREAADRRASTK